MGHAIFVALKLWIWQQFKSSQQLERKIVRQANFYTDKPLYTIDASPGVATENLNQNLHKSFGWPGALPGPRELLTSQMSFVNFYLDFTWFLLLTNLLVIVAYLYKNKPV